jgi:hypothetical protein
MTKIKTMQCGTPLSDSEVLFASTSDDPRVNGMDLTYVFRLEITPKQTPPSKGVWKDYDWLIVSIFLWAQHNFRCVLSREGQVRLYGPGGKPDHIYQIPEAGVFCDTANHLGYVNRIRAVGDQLFVCGQSRQVYRFNWNGVDLAAGQWLNVAGAMRQPPMPEPPDDATQAADEDALDRWMDDNEAIDLVDIHGSSANDLYTVGDEAWHWNGRNWTQLQLPTDEPLAAIKVFSADIVVFVGHNGTLLHGNAREGFKSLSTVNDNQNFTAVEWFQNRLFMASNFGLFTYDLERRVIEPYASDLKPELQDTHHLEAKDGVLWSFGFKDLAYFDGKTWTRVDHPDNPPIR